MKHFATACLSLGLFQAGEALSEPHHVPQALARIAALHARAEDKLALELADGMLARETPPRLSDTDRAELHFARGVLLAALERSNEPPVERRTGAGEAFARARALAGPGELRLDGIYDLGTLHLEDGEVLRARIPEIAGQSPGATLAEEPASDPLPKARSAYLAAKDAFLERIRLDARDVDTRANLELVARRIAELEAIEKQREEQQDASEQQSGPKDPKDSSKQDPAKQDQEKRDPSKDDQDPKDSNPSGEKPDADRDPAREERSEEQDGAAQEQGEESEPSEEQAPPKAGEPEQADAPPDGGVPAEPQELVLTKEEVRALLDHLAELEEQAQALDARMRSTRAVRVRKDW